MAVTTSPEVPKKRKGGWPKGKKRKNTPEVNAPRAPMTGYVLYAIERRQEIKQSNPDIAFAEVTKILGQEWSDMPADKKQHYLEEAEADKQRYIRELTAFQQSEQYQNLVRKRRSAKNANGVVEGGDHYEPLLDLEDDCINELHCRVCNLYFSSLHNKKEHMFGRQHLQAITGELEKELQQQQQNQQQQQQQQPPPQQHSSMLTASNFTLTPDLTPDSLTSLSDSESQLPPQSSPGPVDVESFIHEFFQKTMERDLEHRSLSRSLKLYREQNQNLCKEVHKLEDYHNKLVQTVQNLKACTNAIDAQINGLKMVPTLFSVINF